MAVQGIFASDAHIVGNRRGDFAGSLLQIMPEGSAQLLALSAGMESADARDVIITWFEESHIAGRLDVTAFVSDGDGTGFTVADASSIVPGTIVMNERTGEYMLVTASVPSTNIITVTRAVTGGAATTVLLTDFFQRIGTAFEEGSSRPVAVVNLGYVRINYCQIFRNSWDVTGTARAVDYYVASPPAKNRADCALFHSEDIEKSLLWGKKAIGVLNSKPFRMMDGMYSMITSNITTAGATTSYVQLDTFFQGIFAKNIKGKPNERIAFCGNKALSVFNNIAMQFTNARITLTPRTTEFGKKTTTWITPYGTVELMTHPLFTESPFFTADTLILHPGAIRTRYLRRTNIDAYDQNGQRAGVDSEFGVYTTEMTCEYRAEITGGIYKQIVAAA